MTERDCACVHPDAHECLRLRYRDTKDRPDPDEWCECECHGTCSICGYPLEDCLCDEEMLEWPG